MADSIDAVVIGAGLSGLMAASCAARGGLRVALVEKQALPGRKYAITSMGKGALSSARLSLESFHGRDARFVADALAALPADALAAWFADHGEALTPGADYGLILPANGPDGALAALTRGLGDAELMLETRVGAVRRAGGRFIVQLDDGRELSCAKLILACGAPNMPQCGGEPTGLEIATALGHSVRPPRPAQVGLVVDDWTRSLAGLWMNVRLSLGAASVEGAVLFTQSGITGEAVFNISGLVPGEAELQVNFFPDLPPEEVERWLHRTLGESTRYDLARALQPILPTKLIEPLVQRQGISPLLRADRIELRQRQGLLADMLGLRLRVHGTMGMNAAEATEGGVNVREINPRTFESRKVPGLYIVGRMLDVSADWGGPLQHFALASGMLAGKSAAAHALDSRTGAG